MRVNNLNASETHYTADAAAIHQDHCTHREGHSNHDWYKTGDLRQSYSDAGIQ